MSYIDPFNWSRLINGERYEKQDNRDKEAYWLIDDEDKRPYCSECNCATFEYNLFDFCPNCGAKMIRN